MLLALRSLYESSVTVVTAAGRTFRGHPPLGRPVFPLAGEAIVRPLKITAEIQKVSASGVAIQIIQAVKGIFRLQDFSANGSASPNIDPAKLALNLQKIAVSAENDDHEAIAALGFLNL